jgi:hypothetical protein
VDKYLCDRHKAIGSEPIGRYVITFPDKILPSFRFFGGCAYYLLMQYLYCRNNAAILFMLLCSFVMLKRRLLRTVQCYQKILYAAAMGYTGSNEV